jgi:hypothetical protein
MTHTHFRGKLEEAGFGIFISVFALALLRDDQRTSSTRAGAPSEPTSLSGAHTS